MNLKRAVWISVLMYFTSFVLGIVASLIGGMDMHSLADVPTSFYVIGMILSIILVSLFSLLYYKDKKVKPSAKEGFYFGLTAILTGIVLDWIIFLVTYLLAGPTVDMWSYYGNVMFWITSVLVIIAAAIVGKAKSKRKKN